jgi:asparagine synthase (glutamine-hydrolysing)
MTTSLSTPPALLAFDRARPGAAPLAKAVYRFPYGGTLQVQGSTLTYQGDLPAVDLFYWRRAGDRLLLSPDVRLLWEPGMSPDPTGLLAMLLIGAPVPPYSLFEGIRAFLPGFRSTIDLRDFSLREEPSTVWDEQREDDRELPAAEQNRQLAAHIDRSLDELELGAEPLVLFSGGVDSSVLTARLVAMGRTGTTLFHYSFGPDHPDHVAAVAIADRLGLPLEIVGPTAGGEADVIDRAAELYRQPFSDHSAVPTHHLASAALQRYRGRPTLDGTGADGAFGLFARARRIRMVYRLPLALRRAACWGYERTKLWRHPGRVELFCRVLRRTVKMPKLSAAICQNALLDIGMHPGQSDRDAVYAALERWIEAIRPQDDVFARVPLADLALVCAGVFAHKDFSHFHDAHTPLHYPYLLPDMVQFALRRAYRWPGSLTPKHALKSLLREQLPNELVDRPKTGFVSGKFEGFRGEPFLERLEAALGPGCVFGSMIDAPFVRSARDHLRAGGRLPSTAYNFLWAITITDSWLRTIAHGAASARRQAGLPPLAAGNDDR